MSVKKYLTLDGLTYFLNKIKSTMADELDGKANDSDVVHKAQTETVTGEKTFKKDVKIIDLNANERPGVQFGVNGSFRTFEQAKDSLPEPDFGDFGGGTLWDGGFLADNTKIQNSMGDYVINDITFGTANYSSVIEFNNYYKVTYEDGHNSPEDVKGMLRFELAPYENVEKDHEYWSDPDLYLYAMLDGGFSGGSTILGHPSAPWSKAYIGEIYCEDIKFGFGMSSIFDVLGNIRNLSYVTHYSSTALTPSSTNSNTLLDNTDNLKVGDKVIDSSGVLFSITAIDTQNSTFTIGTALIDLAQDSDVVHKSGDETVGGKKTFDSNTYVYNSDTNATTPNLYLKSSKVEVSSQGNTSGDQNLVYLDKNNTVYAYVKGAIQSNGSAVKIRAVAKDSSDNSVINELQMLAYTNGNKAIFPTYSNEIDLGGPNYKWKSVYATNYYYGSNNVEFSTKFVTTDTNQTISGQKVFDDINTMSSASEIGVSGGNRSYKVLDKNKKILAKIEGGTFSSGMAYSYWLVNTGTDLFNGVSLYQPSANLAQLRPYDSTLSVQLGATNRYFSNCYTSKINGVEPSSLSLPSDNINAIIDISSYLSVLDGSNANTYVAPANGWISITMSSCSGIQAYITGLWGHQIVRPTVGGVRFFMPVLKNKTVNILIFGGTIDNARFIPCQGNV